MRERQKKRERERQKVREDKRRREEEATLAECASGKAVSLSSTHQSLSNVAKGDVVVTVRSETSSMSRLLKISRFNCWSEHEMIKMERLLAKNEKKDVIVITELSINEITMKNTIFLVKILKHKLAVQLEVKSVQCIGKVVLARMKSHEDKKSIVSNTNKLTDTRIFIDNFRYIRIQKNSGRNLCMDKGKERKEIQN